MLKSNPPVSNIVQQPKKTRNSSVGVDRSLNPAPTPSRNKRWSTRFASAVRWLHIYVSLLAFTALVFFGVTGITLNHPDWFNTSLQHVAEHEGNLNPQWVQSGPEDNPETLHTKLDIVEYLRATHQLRGAVSEFRIDEWECLILFKGPAYAADVIVDRKTGKYSATVSRMGLVAMMNDLHKGRDSGSAWSIVIDIVSLATVFVSVTGLILLFYLKRKRVSGTITTLAGTALLIAVLLWLVP